MEPQKKNLIIATIHPSTSSPHLPTIKMITEAGMIGKIGHNSSGVGVCFNAIRASGLAVTRIPVHLGLRMALESFSAAEAVAKLEKEGMASSAHMLIADQGQGVGCEFTSTTFQKLEPDKLGRVVHSNHLLLKHKDVYEPPWLADSPFRVEKMTELTDDTAAKAATKTNGEVKGKGGEGVGWEDFEAVFRDESNYPNAICRAQVGDSTTASLFNIVMDLKERKAIVRLGRPCQVEETVELKFN
jgi:isopenicillin-N N-acyltransferase-like protein